MAQSMWHLAPGPRSGLRTDMGNATIICCCCCYWFHSRECLIYLVLFGPSQSPSQNILACVCASFLKRPKANGDPTRTPFRGSTFFFSPSGFAFFFQFGMSLSDETVCKKPPNKLAAAPVKAREGRPKIPAPAASPYSPPCPHPQSHFHCPRS